MAPITCSSPRAKDGLKILAASIAPSPPPAPKPTNRCSSSIKTINCSRLALISSMIAFSRSSVSPRKRVPDNIAARSSSTTRLPNSASGTLPLAIRWARPSTIAVLPTPGSPIITGLFFVRRAKISMAVSISCARPITGSSLPWRANWLKSRENLSRVGVFILIAASLA